MKKIFTALIICFFFVGYSTQATRKKRTNKCMTKKVGGKLLEMPPEIWANNIIPYGNKHTWESLLLTCKDISVAVNDPRGKISSSKSFVPTYLSKDFNQILKIRPQTLTFLLRALFKPDEFNLIYKDISEKLKIQGEDKEASMRNNAEKKLIQEKDILIEMAFLANIYCAYKLSNKTERGHRLLGKKLQRMKEKIKEKLKKEHAFNLFINNIIRIIDHLKYPTKKKTTTSLCRNLTLYTSRFFSNAYRTLESINEHQPSGLFWCYLTLLILEELYNSKKSSTLNRQETEQLLMKKWAKVETMRFIPYRYTGNNEKKLWITRMLNLAAKVGCLDLITFIFENKQFTSDNELKIKTKEIENILNYDLNKKFPFVIPHYDVIHYFLNKITDVQKKKNLTQEIFLKAAEKGNCLKTLKMLFPLVSEQDKKEAFQRSLASIQKNFEYLFNKNIVDTSYDYLAEYFLQSLKARKTGIAIFLLRKIEQQKKLFDIKDLLNKAFDCALEANLYGMVKKLLSEKYQPFISDKTLYNAFTKYHQLDDKILEILLDSVDTKLIDKTFVNLACKHTNKIEAIEKLLPKTSKKAKRKALRVCSTAVYKLLLKQCKGIFKRKDKHKAFLNAVQRCDKDLFEMLYPQINNSDILQKAFEIIVQTFITNKFLQFHDTTENSVIKKIIMTLLRVIDIPPNKRLIMQLLDLSSKNERNKDLTVLLKKCLRELTQDPLQDFYAEYCYEENRDRELLILDEIQDLTKKYQ